MEPKTENVNAANIKDGSRLQSGSKITYAGLFVVVVAFMLFFGLYGFAKKQNIDIPSIITPDNNTVEIEKFRSETEFKKYLLNARDLSSVGTGSLELRSDMAAKNSLDLAPQASLGLAPQAVSEVNRFSGTNVQVVGVDEPDIVKTDGKNIFLSGQNYFIDFPGRPVPLMLEDTVTSTAPAPSDVSALDEKIVAPDYIQKQTIKIVSAFPPQNLKKLSEIIGQGEMLLSRNMLIVFTYNKITGYDVGDTANPQMKWSLELDSENNNQLVSSRLKDGKIYTVTKNNVSEFSPCAIPLIKDRVQILCTDIYRPSLVTYSDALITAMEIDPVDGSIDKKVSFMGSSSNSLVYMSPENLYITYPVELDFGEFIYNFLKGSANDLVPQEIIAKIEKIRSYEISNQSKMAEIERVLQAWQSSLGKDERLKVENEIANRGKEYINKHARDLQSTALVKISLSKFAIAASSKVPGQPLNQFSLDEYKDHLRIATTIGNNWWGFGIGGEESFSDVYVLDESLNKKGEVLDLGRGEKIYSVRFIGNRGYVVTFKQIDPFYVLDLADASHPAKVGELKIPGFSSYLHPLKDDLVLGVGQENGQVKVSVFDVSNATTPTELYKYNLNDGWSEVSNNHHAFLNDPENQRFFIPGGLGGYVFSYKNNLVLEKAFAGYSVRRAVYVNNYFYVIGDTEISAYNQSDWSSVNSLKLN